MTAATDVLVAAASATFALRIVRATADRAARLVAATLAMSAFSALAGAVYHMARGRAIWNVTALAVGIGTYLFGSAIALAYFSARGQRITQILLLAQLISYILGVAFSDDFRIVIADYASVTLAILFVCFFHWTDAAARWIAAGVVISFAAAGAQMSAIQIGPLNHNDVYHLIELPGLYCWYRGGKRLTARATEQPMTPPS